MLSAHLQWSTLLFVLLPDWLAYGLLMFLQRFVAGYFMFRLLRDSLNLDVPVAFFGGLAFASITNPQSPGAGFAGFTIYNELALPAFPLVAWLLWYSSIQSTRRAYIIAACTGIGWALFSSYAFVLFFLPFLVLWFLFVERLYTWRFWFIFVIFCSAWILISLPSLVPTVFFAGTSHRADRDTLLIISPELSYWIVHSIILGLNYLFPLLLGVLGAIAARGRDWRLNSVLSIVAGILLFYGFFPLISRFLLTHLDILENASLHVRLTVLLPFFAVVAGGLGLHHLFRGRYVTLTRDTTKQLRFPLQWLLTGLAIMVLFYQQLEVQKLLIGAIARNQTFANVYQHPDLQNLAQQVTVQQPFRVATIHGNNVHPAFAWAYGLETVDGYLNLYPQRYEDFWTQVLHPLQELDLPNYEYYTEWGNRIYLFAPGSSRSQLAAPTDATWAEADDFFDLELLAMANVRYIISPYQLENVPWRKLPSQLNEDQVYLSDGSTISKLHRLIAQRGAVYDQLYVYENPEVLPRFFVVHDLQTFNDQASLLQTLHDASLRELATTAYLYEDDLPADVRGKLMFEDGQGSSQVTVSQYTTDQIVLDVQTETPGVLIVTNNYIPYWIASIDSEEVPVFPVDHAFQGVYISDGSHQVVLQYTPPWKLLP
jgi:hypothetical protein